MKRRNPNHLIVGQTQHARPSARAVILAAAAVACFLFWRDTDAKRVPPVQVPPPAFSDVLHEASPPLPGGGGGAEPYALRTLQRLVPVPLPLPKAPVLPPLPLRAPKPQPQRPQPKWLQRAPLPVRQMIIDAAHRHGANPSTLLAIAWRESKFHQGCYLGPASCSRGVLRGDVGELGMFQIRPSTARGLGCGNIRSLPFNVDCAARYVARLERQFGERVRHVAAGYNGGPANARRMAYWPYADEVYSKSQKLEG